MLFECGVNFIVVECVAFYALQPKYEEKKPGLHSNIDQLTCSTGWVDWVDDNMQK